MNPSICRDATDTALACRFVGTCTEREQLIQHRHGLHGKHCWRFQLLLANEAYEPDERAGIEQGGDVSHALQIPPEALGTCRSCHAPLIWVLTERGRRMPLDREETMERGALLFVIDEHGVAHRSRTGSGRKSHFSTCPDAGRWRKDHA